MRRPCLIFVLMTAAGCGETTGSAPDPPVSEGGLVAVEVASDFELPVLVVAPPGDPRLFVVEQRGRIRIIEEGQIRTTPFLDLRDRVVTGGERGLLGLAFHPQYAQNGRFFVNYTGENGATRVEEYRVSSDPNRADPASARLLLTVAQPFANHNGGMIEFGPDGMLYIGMGDGGSGGDPRDHGQNPATLLGAILRIDVDGGDPYAIPHDNPYVGSTDGLPEIWATGLRNPWRFSFDPEGGMIYIADVGQNRREEVNARPAEEAGLNYGWNVMEGTSCFEPSSGCGVTGLILPVLEYSNPSQGCAVTGGRVYRGDRLPGLRGHYFYADYCEGWVRSFRLSDDGVPADQREWSLGNLGRITSFGEDSDRELYVVVHQGSIYRLEPE